MKEIAKRLLVEEDGTALILLAVALTVLIGFTALVTDLGNVYLHRAKISNTIDSAVMAGAQELPADPPEALNIAQEYAQANGMRAGEYDFEISADGRSISGKAQRQVDMFLARVLGIDHSDINARATARVAPLTAVTGVVPFGVVEGNYSFGNKVVLKRGDNNLHGWFGALALGGFGADVYRNNIKYGYQNPLHISSEVTVPVEPGNMSGPTTDGVVYRLGLCHHVPQCSISSYVEGCPRICIVPLGIWDNGTGSNRKFTVTSFAAFLITAEEVLSGNENNVTGSFIRYVMPGEIDEDGPETGLYGMRLIE